MDVALGECREDATFEVGPWMGGRHGSRSLSSAAWQEVWQANGDLTVWSGSRDAGGVLYRARRLLQDGAVVYMGGDGGSGRVVFSVDFPGGSARIRAGWFVAAWSQALDNKVFGIPWGDKWKAQAKAEVTRRQPAGPSPVAASSRIAA